MRLLQSMLFALVLIPLLSSAQVFHEQLSANEATYKNVSAGCYSAFKTVFGMLPDIADKINEDKGEEILVITNVKTPLGNPSTFSMTVEKAPPANSVGDYKLYQKYSNSNLYLRLDLMPAGLTDEQLTAFWQKVGEGFAACPL